MTIPAPVQFDFSMVRIPSGSPAGRKILIEYGLFIARGKYSKRRAGGTNEGCHRRKCFRGREFGARKSGALFQAFSLVGGEQGAHLGDGDAVECGEAFGLGQTFADEDGVEALEIRQDDELLQRGVVADVAIGVGMSVAPLLRGLAEEGDVEKVGLAGVNGGSLRLRNGGGNERLLDGVCVDAVVDLGESALEVPVELEAVVFLVLEALEFLDEVELELDRDP